MCNSLHLTLEYQFALSNGFTHHFTCTHAHTHAVEGNGHFFPSYRQLYLSSFSDTPRPTQRRSLQMLGVAVPQIGVGVFHAWLFHDRADGWVSRLTGGVPAVVVQSEALWARIPEIQVRIPSRAMGTFFPHTVSSIFRLSLTHTHTHTHSHTHSHTHTHTHTHIHTHTRPTQRRSLQMLDVTVPQIGVGVFHAWLFHDRADGWVSKVFVSTDGRRACCRGVIGSTMGAYPRDTGSNSVEGNGHFFPSYRQLYLSSFSDNTHTHTHTHVRSHVHMHAHTHTHTHAHTHTHTHTHKCVHAHTHLHMQSHSINMIATQLRHLAIQRKRESKKKKKKERSERHHAGRKLERTHSQTPSNLFWSNFSTFISKHLRGDHRKTCGKRLKRQIYTNLLVSVRKFSEVSRSMMPFKLKKTPFLTMLFFCFCVCPNEECQNHRHRRHRPCERWWWWGYVGRTIDQSSCCKDAFFVVPLLLFACV